MLILLLNFLEVKISLQYQLSFTVICICFSPSAYGYWLFEFNISQFAGIWNSFYNKLFNSDTFILDTVHSTLDKSDLRKIKTYQITLLLFFALLHT